MDKNFLIQLTNELYRLTLLFPKKEPLRYKMRELAIEILAKINRDPTSVNPTEIGSLSFLEELEILDSYFELSKNQNWVKLEEILKVQKEYSKIKLEIFEKSSKIGEFTPLENPNYHINQTDIISTDLKNNFLTRFTQVKPMSDGISGRQERILEFLKENGQTQVWQIKQIFPEVTKRTLRRDFEHLLKQNIIERIGERNNTFYQVKPSI